jgi:carbon storage regulator CsrA
MLLLTRKRGEKVVIGEHITIVVATVTRGRVQLAFDAPSDVRILRAELAGRPLASQAGDTALRRGCCNCLEQDNDGSGQERS